MRKCIRIYAFVAIYICMLNGCAPATQPGKISRKETGIFHVYLLLGQSNMAGRGVVEPEDQQVHPRIHMLDKNNEWKPASDPMHFDKPIAGVGPGLTFGKLMADTDSKITIGLVPCAAGGSSIDAWKVGGYHDQTKSYPYDEALKRARIAMQTGQLKGIIWHQGESDSEPGKADTYAQKLKELIANLRKELNAPDLPVVVATLPDFYANRIPEAAKVNQALQELPGQMPSTACISTADLTHKGDTIHFDSPSARELGRRYAKAMQTLQQNTAIK
ncbi:sialate O-acetylesterase [Rhodocytophaga rosea]|uniref:Sialate O-acetylesterase n=1 Tax=Rhodocytophaga rosea TaxID=2704465 RepID=A0A6C0GE07_9BACT|nr:sialate O-acetylesterase [Rhodocytophaga rosea]QHT65920.1 sialate O-acetylesterase [Rhodocytophaga rosea]